MITTAAEIRINNRARIEAGKAECEERNSYWQRQEAICTTIPERGTMSDTKTIFLPGFSAVLKAQKAAYEKAKREGEEAIKQAKEKGIVFGSK